MAQRVRADVVHSRADAYVLLNHPAHRARGNSRSLVVQKKRFLIPLRDWRVEEKLVSHTQVVLNCVARRISKWHNSLLPPLSGYAYQLITEIYVRNVKGC